MNEVLQSWLDQEEERLIDQKNVHSLYICASRAKEVCKLTGTESELLFHLACYADYDGTNISVGRDRLMQRTGYSANTIGSAMKTLQRKGLVIRDGYGKFGVAKYRLNLPGHYMYIDPKQTDKVTPLPTSRIKNAAPQEVQVQQVQVTAAPQDIQVQQVQVTAAPQDIQVQDLADIFEEDLAAPSAPQDIQVQVQQVQQVQQSPAREVQQVQQVQVQVQVQQATPSPAREVQVQPDQPPAIVESTVSYPSVGTIDEEIERRIKLFLCAKKGNAGKPNPVPGFGAIGRRLNFDEHEIEYLWSHPVTFEDVCEVYRSGIPEQKRSELIAVSSDQTDLPF